MQTDLSWSAVLAHHATRTPDKAMTVFEGVTITYGEMADRVAALAGGLAEQGIGAGDVVGLLSHNCPEMLETIFAANHLGAIAMPINWRLAPAEVRYILEHAEAGALVCDEALAEVAGEATKGMEDDLVRAHVTDARPTAGPRSTTCDPAPADRRPWRRRPTTSTASCTRRAPPDAPRASCSPTPTWRGRTSPTSSSSASTAATSAWHAARCTTSARSTSPRPPCSPPGRP